jgi:Flp pilus assembly protein TadD
VFVHITQTRATLYQDPVALWRDAAERSEHKTRPLVNLGTLLAKRGELHEAEAALGAALKRDPSSLEIHSRLGAIRRLRALGDPSLRQ